MFYVLTKPPRNAQQTLEVLVVAMRALDLEDTCGPLIHFLIFATTDNNASAVPNTVQDHAGEAFHNSVLVSRARHHTTRYAQLPSLKPTPNGRDSTLHRLLGAIREVQDGVLTTLHIAKSTALSGRPSKVSSKGGTTKRLTEFAKCAT